MQEKKKSVLTTGFFVSGSNSVEFASETGVQNKHNTFPLFYKHYKLTITVLRHFSACLHLSYNLACWNTYRTTFEGTTGSIRPQSHTLPFLLPKTFSSQLLVVEIHWWAKSLHITTAMAMVWLLQLMKAREETTSRFLLLTTCPLQKETTEMNFSYTP